MPRQADLTITDRELFYRLGWFTHVRWAFGLFCLLMLLICWHVLGVRFRIGDGPWTMAPAAHVVLAMFLYNAVFTFAVRIIRSGKRTTRHMIVFIALAQIMCDLVSICALIHYTGGVENVFVILILVPIVIVTELLPQALAYATAGGAAVLINALAWGEQQGFLQHAHVELVRGNGPPQAIGLYLDSLYVLHVTTALTVTIFAMVFIASTIAARLRKREAELEEAHRKLRIVDETKGFFMRKAGHEMRSPLAAIHSILNAITSSTESLSAEQSRLLGRARYRTKAMMAMVADLIRYSRLRSPEAVFQTKPIYLSNIVTNTVELHRKHAEIAGIELSCRTEPAWIKGDEELLRELATNLLANAIQYTPAGGSIEVTLTKQAKTVLLTVADTGIGINEQEAEMLFEAFYRSSQAKKTFLDGTGLGLAIVNKIIQIHGGSINARPGPSGGTVFTVELPAQERSDYSTSVTGSPLSQRRPGRSPS